MKNIAIIGFGRAGGSFRNVLNSSKIFKINAIIDRNASNFKDSNLSYCGDSVKKAIKYGDIIIIATPDDVISDIAKELSETDYYQKIFFHLSGSRPSSILNVLKKNNSFIGSIHPLQSLPDPVTGAKNLKNAYFCLEGDKEAVEIAKAIVNEISGKFFTIDSKYKYLYHAAAVFSSNFINTTVYSSYLILKKIGVSEDIIIELLMPLISGTVKNIENLGVLKSLTGPVMRGDKNTIEGHINNFEKFYPELLSLYIELSLNTVNLARETNSNIKYEAIIELLKDLRRKK